MTTQIFVSNKDLGFLTQEVITAQRFEVEDGEPVLIWCNHAGAVDEVWEQESHSPDGRDEVWDQRVQVCDKPNCDAYRFIGESFWYDAPFSGVTEASL